MAPHGSTRLLMVVHETRRFALFVFPQECAKNVFAHLGLTFLFGRFFEGGRVRSDPPLPILIPITRPCYFL